MKKISVLFVLAFFLFLSSCAFSQDQTTSIGCLMDSNHILFTRTATSSGVLKEYNVVEYDISTSTLIAPLSGRAGISITTLGTTTVYVHPNSSVASVSHGLPVLQNLSFSERLPDSMPVAVTASVSSLIVVIQWY